MLMITLALVILLPFVGALGAFIGSAMVVVSVFYFSCLVVLRSLRFILP